MEAIILAGGRGTRLGARLENIPKPMAPIGDRPFLEILLERLWRGGCNNAIISVGHLHSVITGYFGVGFRGMVLEYVIEDQPLGTGGAIRKALSKARDTNVLILNGDTLVDINYASMLSFHAKQDTAITIGVVQQKDVSRFGGLTVVGGRIVSFAEKGQAGPGWINAGVYAMRSKLTWPDGLPGAFSFESDFLMRELAQLRPAAYPVGGYFLDIGVPGDLDRAQAELLSS